MREWPTAFTLLTVTEGVAVSGQRQSKSEAAASVAGKWTRVLEMSMGTAMVIFLSGLSVS